MKNVSRLLIPVFASCLLICASCTPSADQAQKAYQAGMQDLQAGSADTAISDFSQAIQLNPKFAQAYFGRATAHAALRNLADAISDYNKAIELDPTNEQAFLQRGVIRFQAMDWAGASDDLSKAIELNTNDAKAYLCRGLMRVGLEDFDSALGDLNTAIRLDPKFGIAFRSRAAVEGVLKDYENGLADASRAIAVGDANELIYRFRGTIKGLLKDRHGSLEDMDKAIQLAPNDATAYADRASAENYWDEFTNADADLRKAFEIDPNCSEAFETRAAVERKQGDAKDALADYKRALAPPVTVNAPQIHIALGNLENDLGQWNDALQDLSIGLAFYPERGYTHLTIFLIQSQLGESNDAQTQLRSYLLSVPASRANEWPASIANFLLGNLSEEEFTRDATAKARRPTDIPAQQCEACYYAAMKQLLAGNKSRALELFQECVATGEDNEFEYKNAQAHLKALKKP